MQHADTAANAASELAREFYRRVIAPSMEWGHLGHENESPGTENVYRLYAAQCFNSAEQGGWDGCVLAVSAEREKGLREDIEVGRRLIKLGPMLFETPDLAQAIQFSDRSFL